jgi:2-polyprenyl-6-methoxyphenol hydroxylase-like FAD-dependent oxidoreductase
MATAKIAIIGAGPSGLTLARILTKNNIPCTVYEGEESASARTQGGSLDLHAKSGQAALSEAGLLPQFEKLARYEGEDLIIEDRHGKAHVEIRDTERGRPEIDRRQLRQMLLDSLPEDTIRWGHRVASVEVGTIHFRDQPTATGFDLIVGADGAWSKVRPLLTTVPPFYSGISGIELRRPDIENRHPELAAMVGKGSHFVFGEGERKVVLSQRQGDGSLGTYAFMHKPENYLKTTPNLDPEDPASTQKLLLEEYANFAPEIKRLVTDFDTTAGDTIATRALYMLPVGLHWPSVPGVTVIGDAAHLMTPFAGEGVNMAMQDALELALSIIEQPHDLAAAVASYEKGMFPRAEQVTQKTWRSTLSRFAPGGIREFRGRVAKMLEQLLGTKEEGKMANVKISEDEL